MAVFRVKWEMDFEADDATDAAKQALGVQRDPESIATVFNVQATQGGRKTGKAVSVDLSFDGMEVNSVKTIA